jgi:hypothetical protein
VEFFFFADGGSENGPVLGGLHQSDWVLDSNGLFEGEKRRRLFFIFYFCVCQLHENSLTNQLLNLWIYMDSTQINDGPQKFNG